MLEIRLAGGLSLRADGAELALPASKRARAVLAYLALNPGPQPRSRLAARFWPDVLDESARASLRVALTELRQALGLAAPYVAATRDTVALDGPDLTVDVREFQRASDEGDALRALEVCGGPILDGFDEEWAIEARDEHMHRLAAAFEAAAAGADDPADAVRLTRAGVALDPLAEAPNRRLIERLAANGDRAAALSASRQFVERLRAQLGIAPSRETRALIDDLRRGEPEPVPPPPGLTRPDETVFVGRRAELARLHASWGGVQMHRDRRIALIAGEPGIGKTRLAQQFASTCLAEGATVLLGRCSEEPLAPFEPFTEALTQAGVAQALAPGAATDDAGARHRLFDAVDSAITDLATTAPLLIVIDDLHWADRGSLLLTSFLLRSSRPGPILMLGTYRDTELGRNTPLTRALAELKRTGALDRIDLRGLPLDDVATLARSMLGSDELAPRVHARTDGNAFFVEEVLRGWADSGAGEVPESVRHAVGLRLSSMGDAANELIAAAAILGLQHDARAFQATAGLQADTAESALDEILRARLLRPIPAPERFEFAHGLVREAVLGERNILRRARLHRRAADALTELGEQQHLEEIAMHLFEAASAEDARRAAELLVRAGRRALERLAYEDAADRFDRARQALELAGAEDDTGSVLLARGDALLRAGEPAEARAAFTAARALALRRADDALLGEAALGFAGLGIAIVDVDTEATARLEEALERVQDRALRSRLQARLAVELYYADQAKSDTHSNDAVATARASTDASALASALSARHVALWRPDRVHDRLAVAEEMIAAAREAGDRHAELQAHNWRVTDLFELGDMTAWRQEAARHTRLAEALRLPSFQWYTPLWAATEAMLAGRYDDVERLSAEAEQAGLSAGDRNAAVLASIVRFCARLEREAFNETDLAFVKDKIANSPAGIAYRGGYTWILAGLGETERARAELHATMELTHAFDANWLSLQVELAEASVLIGDATFAAALYERLMPYAGRPVTAGRAACSYGAVDRSLGGLASLLGRGRDAVRHLEDAIQLNDAFGAAVWRARAERDLARTVSRGPLVG